MQYPNRLFSAASYLARVFCRAPEALSARPVPAVRG
jgi:hypothetical protein